MLDSASRRNIFLEAGFSKIWSIVANYLTQFLLSNKHSNHTVIGECRFDIATSASFQLCNINSFVRMQRNYLYSVNIIMLRMSLFRYICWVLQYGKSVSWYWFAEGESMLMASFPQRQRTWQLLNQLTFNKYLQWKYDTRKKWSYTWTLHVMFDCDRNRIWLYS